MANNCIEIWDDYDIIRTEVEEVLWKYEEGFPPGIAVDEEENHPDEEYTIV